MRRITLLMLLAFSLLPLPVCGDQPSTNKKEAAAPVGAKKPSTPKEKFAEIIQAAESGDAKAQFRLGVMYAKGEGVPMDAAKSLEWHQKAAEQGDADAPFILRIMYNNYPKTPY